MSKYFFTIVGLVLLTIQSLFGFREVIDPKEEDKPAYISRVYRTNLTEFSVEIGTVGIILSESEIICLCNVLAGVVNTSKVMQDQILSKLSMRSSRVLQAKRSDISKVSYPWLRSELMGSLTNWEDIENFDKREIIPLLQYCQGLLSDHSLGDYIPVVTRYTDRFGNIITKDQTPVILAELLFPTCEVTIQDKKLADAVAQITVDSVERAKIVELGTLLLPIGYQKGKFPIGIM